MPANEESTLEEAGYWKRRYEEASQEADTLRRHRDMLERERDVWRKAYGEKPMRCTHA